MKPLALFLAVALLAPAIHAQAKPRRIFIVSDGEGIAGICHQDQTDPKGSDLPELLTGEVNAAAEGFFQGGADEVIIWDGHGAAHNLSATTIHKRARLIIGALPALSTLDSGYTAIAFVGQHAMANVPNAIMAHSFSSLGIQNMKVNGKPVGEIDIRVALAGQFGSPVIFLSGDEAAVAEIKEIVPQVETAAVKKALQRNSCDTMSAAAARELIQEKAKASMSLIGKIKPYTVNGPITLELEFTTRNSLTPDAKLIPHAKVIDDRTIQYQGDTLAEAWTRYRTTTR